LSFSLKINSFNPPRQEPKETIMAILAIEDVQNLAQNLLPIPDWHHLDVDSIKLIWIEFKDIYIDDINFNETKVNAHTSDEIQKLEQSFRGGVDTREFTPAVEEYFATDGKRYKLVYGYGRSEALRGLGLTGWFFVVLKGNADSIEDVQAQENEQLPKRINKEVDMRHFLSNKVRSGKIENTETAIKAKFRKVYHNRAKDVRNRIVQQVMEDCHTPQPYILYTSVPKIQDWLEHHSAVHLDTPYSIKASFDANRNMYGVVVKEGYQNRTVVEAVKRYKETGKKTYIIGHCGGPTDKQTFKVKRKQFVIGYKEIEMAFKHVGARVFPIKIMGFLPQDREVENLKVLIDPPRAGKLF